MVSTRRQKQALAAVSNPLRDVGIVQTVLTYLPGCWLFLGAKCREWKALYADMADQQMHSLGVYSRRSPFTFGSKATLYSAAVASPATARQACECRLAAAIRKDARLQHIAGLFADMETLLALRELGMPLSDDVVRAVAQSGRLDILQHLIREQQCPTPQALSHWAAHSGNIDMLEWLRAEGLCEFDHNMCAGAAEGRHLAVLQHLRSLWLGRVVHCLFCGERWQHRSGRVAAAAGRRTVWS
jgi:hypothetical protein